jgi:hypothetical protein
MNAIMLREDVLVMKPLHFYPYYNPVVQIRHQYAFERLLRAKATTPGSFLSKCLTLLRGFCYNGVKAFKTLE